MSAWSIGKVLADESRWRLLLTLMRGPKDIDGLSKQVGLKPTAIRHHLQALMSHGLVEESKQLAPVGRPKVLYHLTKKRVALSFPRREYEMLCEILLTGLPAHIGENQIHDILRKVARGVGRRFLYDLAQKHGVTKWTPELFRRYFVDTNATIDGTEVVKITESSVTYRQHNCPFYELAMKYPDLVCADLDLGFTEGLAEGLGKEATVKRVKCMGHGDPFCEYVTRWRS